MTAHINVWEISHNLEKLTIKFITNGSISHSWKHVKTSGSDTLAT